MNISKNHNLTRRSFIKRSSFTLASTALLGSGIALANTYSSDPPPPLNIINYYTKIFILPDPIEVNAQDAVEAMGFAAEELFNSTQGEGTPHEVPADPAYYVDEYYEGSNVTSVIDNEDGTFTVTFPTNVTVKNNKKSK